MHLAPRFVGNRYCQSDWPIGAANAVLFSGRTQKGKFYLRAAVAVVWAAGWMLETDVDELEPVAAP
jgi:hypothetical protein